MQNLKITEEIHFWLYYTKNVSVIDGTMTDMVVLWFLLLVMVILINCKVIVGDAYKTFAVLWSLSEILINVAERLETLLKCLSVFIMSWSHHWEGSLRNILCWLCLTLILTLGRSRGRQLKREIAFWVGNTGNKRRSIQSARAKENWFTELLGE